MNALIVAVACSLRNEILQENTLETAQLAGIAFGGRPVKLSRALGRLRSPSVRWTSKDVRRTGVGKAVKTRRGRAAVKDIRVAPRPLFP